jgi:hypothetical protein
MKSLKVIGALALISSAMLVSSVALAGNNSKGRGAEGSPVVFVTSHGLYYDSIVVADLPVRGRFQKLVHIDGFGLMTEFGPGDKEYVGGRWWLDANGNNEMDDGDAYFLCPLLGPGRTDP